MKRFMQGEGGNIDRKWEIPNRGDIVRLSSEYCRQIPNAWRSGERAIVLRDSVAYGCVWLQWGNGSKSVSCCSNLEIVERFNLF
jgi:hypothetical protein